MVKVKDKNLGGNKMKLTNLKVEYLDDFFETVKKCKGNVYLECDDMRLNLKSKLCQYVSLTKLCSAGSDEIEALEIKVENPDDVTELVKFMFNEK